jgi:hypothetical protein
MRAFTARTAIAIFAVAGVSLTSVGVISAHDDACELRLREAPLETAELPPGWDWDFFTLEDHGAPAFEASVDAGGFAVSVELTCVSDPEGMFERIEELRLVADNDKIGVIEIGDEAFAAREFSDYPTIRWRHDDIVGKVSSCDEVDYGDLEVFAQRIDALLPSIAE